MAPILSYFLLQTLRVMRNMWGLIHAPYQTYRTLVKENPYQVFFIFFLVGAYYFVISPIRLHTFHPLLLTFNTIKLFTVSMITWSCVVAFFYLAGKAAKQKFATSSLILSWGYSLVPTLVWFITTSVFYVVLPPPRQETWPGRFFSILYLAFSLSLFFWKALLYYLTLRFGLKFDLSKIIGTSMVFLPMLMLYSLVMYRLGIFRVPFV